MSQVGVVVSYAPHDGMQRRRRETYGRHGLVRSGRIIGSREGDRSSAAAGLVAVASANPGGSGHCEWPRVVSGRATRGRERRNTAVRNTAFARCVWDGHWVRCGRYGHVFLALARSAARRLGDSAAWRLVARPTGPVGKTPEPGTAEPEPRRTSQCAIRPPNRAGGVMPRRG